MTEERGEVIEQDEQDEQHTFVTFPHISEDLYMRSYLLLRALDTFAAEILHEERVAPARAALVPVGTGRIPVFTEAIEEDVFSLLRPYL